MANSNRVILVEPPVNQGRNIVEHEDLIIYLELTAKIPARSIIKNEETLKGSKYSNDSQDKSDVSFTFPVEEGKAPVLNTSWTEIGGKSKEETIQGFGITNVDIQFDASFVPRITIDFVDIRGAALFEDGNKSKYYGALFHLPYPLYSLTFKGYYGDAVTYPLHLMKFNSKFNGETGNFEIRCDFIGHTFALLSDLLMGFSIAGPYMVTGGKEECSCTGKDIDTIRNFIAKAKKVNDDMDVAKSMPERDNLQLIEDYKKDINELRKKIISQCKEQFSSGEDMTLRKFTKNNFFNGETTDSINKNILDVIKRYNLGFFSEVNELMKKLLTKGINRSVQDSTHLDYEVDGVSIIYDGIPHAIRTKVNSVPFTDIIDNKLSVQLQISEQQIKNELKTASDKILASNDFNPTVKNAVNVLMCGFEIFLNKLMNVSVTADNNRKDGTDPISKFILKNDTQHIDGKDNVNKRIYPWPLYYKSKGDQFGAPVLTYPGEDAELADMPEVLFVQNFIDTLYAQQQEISASDQMLSAGSGWIPSNIIESTLMLGQSIDIPYNGLDYFETLRLILSRVMVQISYSYPQGLVVSERSWIEDRGGETFKTIYGDMFGKSQSLAQRSIWDNFVPQDEIKESWYHLKVAGSIIKMLAKAEAGIFYQSSTSDKIIEMLSNLRTGDKLLSEIERLFITKKNKVYDDGSQTTGDTSTYLVKTDKEIKVKQVSEPSFKFSNNSFTPAEGTDFYYFVSTEQTNTDQTLNPQFGDDVKLQINDNSVVSGYFDPNDPDSVIFEIVTKSVKEKRDAPKNNKEIQDLLDGFDGINKFEFYFQDSKLSRFNVVEFFTEEGNQVPFINDKIRDENRAEQESKGIDYYEDDLVNVCLESMDGDPKENPIIKTNESGIPYGDFPTYVMYDDILKPSYVGQIQDTQWYLSNSGRTDTYYNEIDGYTYEMSELSTAYLWLNSLELTLGVDDIGDPNDTFNSSLAYSSGIVEIPQVVLLWIGATLWRYYYMEANNNTDPIKYGDKSILSGGAFSASTYSVTDKVNLGIHYDFLRNYAKYDESGLQTYVNSDFIDTNDFGGSKSSIGFPYFTLNGKEPISPIKDDVSMYGFIKAPKKIRDIVIGEFINWATSNLKSMVDFNWDVVRENIEDRDLVRRHFINKIHTYDILTKKSLRSYRNVGSTFTPYTSYGGKVTIVGTSPYTVKWTDNCGNLNEWDKAIFTSGYYVKSDFEGPTPSITVTQSGYQINNTVTPTGQRPIYSSRFRFLKPETFLLLNVKQTVLYILNGTWRNFIFQKEDTIEAGVTPQEPINNYLPTFYADSKTLSLYLTNFIDEINKIKDDKTEEKIKRPPNSIDDPNIKLDIYIKCKNLYDKWLASKNFVENGKICLSKYFRFIDRAMNNIGDLAIINPKSITELYDNSNTSVYNVLYEMLSQNNFDFHPLPHFSDFGNIGNKGVERIKRMFEPQTIVRTEGSAPAFVCIYIGSRADTVDFNNSEYGNNSVDFIDASRTPPDFNSNSKNKLAVFKLTFGKENQNIFKTINFDQSEYQETSESLQVIDDLSKQGKEANSIAYKGTDLLQLYSKRSYTCQVEMLGCAVIEPLMYFQLTNVPMFAGAFMVTKLSHNITPNHMTTSFSGVKIPFTNVPVITEFAIAGGLFTGGSGGGGNYNVPHNVVDADRAEDGTKTQAKVVNYE